MTVAHSGSVPRSGLTLAPMPRHTLRQHSGVVLLPLERPLLGRQLDCLARPETLERANVHFVLTALRPIAAALQHR